MIEWIPVTERLPDSDRDVLVWTNEAEEDGGPRAEVGGLDGKTWFSSEGVMLSAVTHWAEINPPK